MEEIKAWRTSDGKTFFDRRKALQHKHDLLFGVRFRDALDITSAWLTDSRIEEDGLMEFLKDNASLVMEYLSVFSQEK